MLPEQIYKHHLCLFKHISLNLSTGCVFVRLAMSFQWCSLNGGILRKRKEKIHQGIENEVHVYPIKKFCAWTLHRLSVKLLLLEQLLSWKCVKDFFFSSDKWLNSLKVLFIIEEFYCWHVLLCIFLWTCESTPQLKLEMSFCSWGSYCVVSPHYCVHVQVLLKWTLWIIGLLKLPVLLSFLSIGLHKLLLGLLNFNLPKKKVSKGFFVEFELLVSLELFRISSAGLF